MGEVLKVDIAFRATECALKEFGVEIMEDRVSVQGLKDLRHRLEGKYLQFSDAFSNVQRKQADIRANVKDNVTRSKSDAMLEVGLLNEYFAEKKLRLRTVLVQDQLAVREFVLRQTVERSLLSHAQEAS